jgi:hypothetical protein
MANTMLTPAEAAKDLTGIFNRQVEILAEQRQISRSDARALLTYAFQVAWGGFPRDPAHEQKLETRTGIKFNPTDIPDRSDEDEDYQPPGVCGVDW